MRTFIFLLLALFGLPSQAQTATVETLPVEFSARHSSPDGSAIGGAWTVYDSVDNGPLPAYDVYLHFPAVWVDGQVHRLVLPDGYASTAGDLNGRMNTFIRAITDDAETIYGVARGAGLSASCPCGVVRWDGVDGAMTFLEGLPEESDIFAVSPDGSVVVGHYPDEQGRQIFRWENGAAVELGLWYSDAYYTSVFGVDEEGRTFGIRQSASEPYHTEAIWWETDGSLTVGPDLGPESITGASRDGGSLVANVKIDNETRTVVSPAKVFRDGEVTEIGDAVFYPRPESFGPDHHDTAAGSQASYDGSMLYMWYVAPTPTSNGVTTQLWIEGVGAAPIHDVLAERYGVDLPACPEDIHTVARPPYGVMSSDGRVLTVACSEFSTPEPDQLTYRITLPATARWADGADGFFDDADRWAPAVVPDSLTAVTLDATSSGHTISLRRDEAAGSLVVRSEAIPFVTLDLGTHTLMLGPSVSALVVGDVQDGALQLDGGRLAVDGNASLGRSGDARGVLTLLGGHALDIDGLLTVAEEGTAADGSGLLVLDGSLTTSGGLILGDGEGTSGLISLFPGTSFQNTTEAATSIGFDGEGVLTADAAFVSHTGPVFLGAFETGHGRVVLENASSMLTTDSLWIGLRGAGELRVASGSGLSTGPVVMGDRAGSVASVQLTGAGSRWDVVGDLVVGEEGSAVLEIADQAFLCRAEPAASGRGDTSSPMAPFGCSSRPTAQRSRARRSVWRPRGCSCPGSPWMTAAS